jgi:hypothetical protein
MGENVRVVQNEAAFVLANALHMRTQLGLETPVEVLSALGMSGFSNARRRFDPTRGSTFEVFAYYRVRSAIMDGVREASKPTHQACARLSAMEALDQAAEAHASAHPAGSGLASNAHTQRSTASRPESILRALDAIFAGVVTAYTIAANSPTLR